MEYINAKVLLPNALVEELQKYIQGGYIYIPADPKQQRSWGELSGYRNELEIRNSRITQAYHRGASIASLADEYCLSICTIRKIIYKK